MRVGHGVKTSVGALSTDGRRKDEILETASRLFASSGLRTSLQEIADACGIKPQSLYHHFGSKEAIVVELVQRYHAEIDLVAETALADLKGSRFTPDNIVELGKAIAQCAARNSAALQFTFYEPSAGAGLELVRLTSRGATAIEFAVLETLRAGRSIGFIRPGIDLVTLADRMCQTFLHVGLYLFHRYTAVDRVADLFCEILLYGVATASPENGELDKSDALVAVDRVIRLWNETDEADAESKVALIRQVARTEFGRRGYEVTTIRDIAAAAGMSIGSVYRAVGSKEELLASIMSSFSRKTVAGWEAALSSDSTAVQKLDALAWLHINVVDRFNDEFKIQLTWLRQSPPEVSNPGMSFPAVLRQLRTLLGTGAEQGEIRLANPAAELTARCVLELTWMPEGIVRRIGKRAALIHARDTVLRGVAVR
ncbi:TetR/AcrR family transcriptional regulator [Nocardia vinacea]|uniref:TetR/AcrR family transcriptional regulator n=1 Tax=Nocardia vinacea TaxID=96468 RepID=UPI001FDEF5A6|nr:TetR/AcrR family transcriptional regulator [Nocardia vinacea]